MFKNDTFTRTGSYHQISASVYNLILGAVLLWGFALNWWMVATIIGGFMFLGCQALEWTHLHHEGFWWGHIPSAEELKHLFDGPVSLIAAQQFANLFFTITGFHGFHVFSGVVINIIILIMTINGTFERRGHYLVVEKVGLYWHFVDLVWVFVFTFFYLV